MTTQNENHPTPLPKVLAQRLQEIYDINRYVLKDCKCLTEREKELIAWKLVTSLSNHFGGQSLYLPHLQSLERHARNAKIRNEFNGINIKPLAKKFQVSQQTIYNITDNK